MKKRNRNNDKVRNHSATYYAKHRYEILLARKMDITVPEAREMLKKKMDYSSHLTILSAVKRVLKLLRIEFKSPR